MAVIVRLLSILWLRSEVFTVYQPIDQLSEKLQWFLLAYPKKHRIKLSFTHRTIENTLKEKISPVVAYAFLKANHYKHIEMDINIEEPSKPKSKHKPLDDLDAILGTTLQPKQPTRAEQEGKAPQSHRMNEHLLQDYNKNKDTVVFHNLVAANMRLVHSVSVRYKNYMNHSLTEDDLVQEGVFGLMEAIERYDPALGYSLSTYATHWIRQRVIRAIINSGTTVRIPVHMVEQIRSVKKAEARLALEYEEEVPIDAVCEELGISKEKYLELKLVEHRFLMFTSLNQYVGTDEGDTELLEFIPNDRLEVMTSFPEEFHDPYELTEKRILRENVMTLLNRLTEREKTVIEYRFGLRDGTRRTLEEIGEILGVTRERVRQIESKALRRLKAVKQKNKTLWIS